MKAKRVSPGKTVKWNDEIVRVESVNVASNVRVTGTVWTRPGRKYVHFTVGPETDVPLCNIDGVLTEGKTSAQIQAESVCASLAEYGVAAELEIDEKPGAVWARVSLHPEYGAVSDGYYGSWYTRTEGRRTTGFRGFTIRGIYRGRKAVSAKITREEFFQEVSDRIFLAQHRMRKEQEETC